MQHHELKKYLEFSFLRIFTSNSDIFNQIKYDETDPMPK